MYAIQFTCKGNVKSYYRSYGEHFSFGEGFRMSYEVTTELKKAKKFNTVDNVKKVYSDILKRSNTPERVKIINLNDKELMEFQGEK